MGGVGDDDDDDDDDDVDFNCVALLCFQESEGEFAAKEKRPLCARSRVVRSFARCAVARARCPIVVVVVVVVLVSSRRAVARAVASPRRRATECARQQKTIFLCLTRAASLWSSGAWLAGGCDW